MILKRSDVCLLPLTLAGITKEYIFIMKMCSKVKKKMMEGVCFTALMNSFVRLWKEKCKRYKVCS